MAFGGIDLAGGRRPNLGLPEHCRWNSGVGFGCQEWLASTSRRRSDSDTIPPGNNPGDAF